MSIIFIRDATNFHEHADTVPPDKETTADTAPVKRSLQRG
jgi:hypothetical protein